MSNQSPTTTSSQASDSAQQPASSRPWMKTSPLVEVSACLGFSYCYLPSVISFRAVIIRPKFQVSLTMADGFKAALAGLYAIAQRSER
jgi:hypothetical protein